MELLYSANCCWVFISKVFIAARPQRKVAQIRLLIFVVSGPISASRTAQRFKPMFVKTDTGELYHCQCARSVG